MAIGYSTTIIGDRLAQLNTDIGINAKLRMYNGARAANVNTAIGAQVMVNECACAAAAFGSVASGVLTAGAIANGTAAASGIATWFRVFKADGTTACVDGYIAQNWSASTAYVVGQQVKNGGNLYTCATAGTSASSGGPTTTGAGITDGTAVWNYVAGGADLILSNTNITSGQTVGVSSFAITGAPV